MQVSVISMGTGCRSQALSRKPQLFLIRRQNPSQAKALSSLPLLNPLCPMFLKHRKAMNWAQAITGVFFSGGWLTALKSKTTESPEMPSTPFRMSEQWGQARIYNCFSRLLWQHHWDSYCISLWWLLYTGNTSDSQQTFLAFPFNK